MDLTQALTISGRGMDAQTERLRVIAENLANEDSTGSTPGATPYRRKQVEFENVLDRTLGAQSVRVKAVVPDQSPFPDMREAERSYTANLNVMQASRSMLSRVIDLLK
jgi:flagellar basal-body rod protein FlgC